MKNYIALLAFILFLSSNVFSQEKILIPTKTVNNVWGATDLEHNEVIPFSYNKVSFYSLGYYLVESNGKKGLYNSEGKQILQAKYDAIRPISEYKFQVFINRRTGVVSKFDKEIIPIRFSTINSVKGRNEIIVSYKGKYSIYNSEGIKLIPFRYNNISFYGDKYFILKEGKKFAICTGDCQSSKLSFYEDIVKVDNIFLVKDNEKWGFIDSNCDIVLEPKYENIKLLNQNYVVVKDGKENAFFDIKGKRVSRFGFEEPFYMFNDNICWTKKKDSWYRYDLKNKKGGYLKFTRLIDSLNGYFRVVNNNFVELIDEDENNLFGGKYHDIIPLNNKLFKVQLSRKWGVVNNNDEIILDIVYDEIDLNTLEKKLENNDDRFNFEIGDVQTPNIYSELFIVKYNNKYGVYNTSGKEIVPLMFDQVGVSVKDLMIWTKYKGKYGVYSRNGDQLLENKFKSIGWNENQKYFTLKSKNSISISDTLGNITQLNKINKVKWSLKKGLFFDDNNELNGLVNIKGDTIVSYKYKQLYDLGKDYFVGVVDSGVYIFNSKASILSKDKFTSIELVKTSANKFLIVQKKGKLGVVKNDGSEFIPFLYDKITFDKKHNLFKLEINTEFVGYYGITGEKYF